MTTLSSGLGFVLLRWIRPRRLVAHVPVAQVLLPTENVAHLFVVISLAQSTSPLASLHTYNSH